MRPLLAALALLASSCCGNWVTVDGRLTGVVVDESGQPIAGATVNPWSHSYGRDGVAETLPDMVCDTTGANGRFTIEGLCMYSDRVIAINAPGYATAQLDPPFRSSCGSGSVRDVRVTLHRQ